jgi:hypothetical protein
VSQLFAPVVSIAPTRRRRFLWAAWWSGPPVRDPFRKPDAFHGGAKTREEALASAEKAAGMRLSEVEPRWARAWGRVLVGQPPWIAKREPAPGARTRGSAETPRASIWSILGVTSHATPEELKRAFRARALETHPDRGGTAEAFRDVKRAYEEAQRRVARPRKRSP